MTEAHFVYVTTPTLALADSIAENLLKERLIACANIIPGMTSIYEWEGQINKGQECVLILKTPKAHLEAVKERVLSLHEYDCPCIVAWPLTYGHPAFLSWIESQTKK